jgi:hypothetical protein
MLVSFLHDGSTRHIFPNFSQLFPINKFASCSVTLPRHYSALIAPHCFLRMAVNNDNFVLYKRKNSMSIFELCLSIYRVIYW